MVQATRIWHADVPMCLLSDRVLSILGPYRLVGVASSGTVLLKSGVAFFLLLTLAVASVEVDHAGTACDLLKTCLVASQSPCSIGSF